MSSRKAVLFRLLALAIGACAGLALCELTLRIAGYAGSSERQARSFDPRFSNIRKDSWVFDFAPDPARHRLIDLRGQRIELPKPESERRVIFLGDSATEGAFVSLSQSYPMVFQRLLDRAYPEHRARCINAGVWGMTTIDEYFLLERQLLSLQPDAVVVGLFMANDINFNLGHPQRELRYRAPRIVDRARRASALAHFLFLQALRWNERWRIVSDVRLGRSLLPVELSLVDEHGLHMLSYPAGELALYMPEPSRLVEEAYSLLRDVLARFSALARAHDFELYVLLIPSPSSVTGELAILHHPNLLAQLRAQGVDIDAHGLDFDAPLHRVKALCESLTLRCVDATPQLRPLGLRAFIPGDEHPSASGHRALARALFAALGERGRSR